MALAAQYDSPSPNPLPLGEGFTAAGNSQFVIDNSQFVIDNWRITLLAGRGA